MSVRRRSSLPSPNRLFHPSHTSRLKSFEYQDYLTEVSKVGLRHVNSALRSVASSPRSQTPKLSSDVSLSESENSVLQYLKDFGKSKIYREANYPRTSTNNDEKRSQQLHLQEKNNS
ncbi:unnamed protein product [Heterobilharzia americana]|nr:unnamed protein product [Heterobilharzia americana]